MNDQRMAHEARWDARAEQIASADGEALAEFVGTVLRASDALSGLVEGGRVSFEPEPAELILEVDLPDTDVIPAHRGWKYTIQKRTIDPIPVGKEAASIYENLIAQIVLAILDAAFRASPPALVGTVSMNGHVSTTDSATGRSSHPCVVTASTERAVFLELDLSHPKLDPKACLKRLGVEISPHPHRLTPIRPMVDFELSKYRIAFGPEALAGLDHRMDLLKMNPYEFERLVKDLFTKMGYDTWRTESSRDDGIDAVATKSDPHMPVEVVVQAKRFKGAVAPKEVQALMGAMAENPTATHGYLVTTSWLSPRSRQRARNQRIQTIERNELVYLIKDLLGYEVLISNSPPFQRGEGSH